MHIMICTLLLINTHLGIAMQYIQSFTSTMRRDNPSPQVIADTSLGNLKITYAGSKNKGQSTHTKAIQGEKDLRITQDSTYPVDIDHEQVYAQQLPAIFGVFDGNGTNGHHASEYVARYLPEKIKTNIINRTTNISIQKAIQAAFKKTNQELCTYLHNNHNDDGRSATTAALVVIANTKKGARAYICNTGDAAVHLHNGTLISDLHNLDNSVEVAQIDAKNIYEHHGKKRLAGQLVLTKWLGTPTLARCTYGSHWKPTIKKLYLANSTSFLISSDGVYPYLKPQDIATVLRTYGNAYHALKKASEYLLLLAAAQQTTNLALELYQTASQDPTEEKITTAIRLALNHGQTISPDEAKNKIRQSAKDTMIKTFYDNALISNTSDSTSPQLAQLPDLETIKEKIKNRQSFETDEGLLTRCILNGAIDNQSVMIVNIEKLQPNT